MIEMNTVLILAGGVGSRIGGIIPKQFIEIDGKPIIIYTLEKFQASKSVDEIYIVCVKEWIKELKELCEYYAISKVVEIVEGGATIFQSTKIGLEVIDNRHKSNPLVLIHESVRPLITASTIDDSFKVAEKYGNAIAATVLVDEIGYNNGTVNLFMEEGMVSIQNPHTFRLNILMNAYCDKNEHIGMNGTALLLYKLGEELHLSKGTPDNFKITFEQDLTRYEALRHLYM